MSNYNRKPITPEVSPQRPRDERIRPDPRQHLDPLGYDHPYPSIQIKDHDELPAVLTREQVRRLLAHIRLRRYLIPIKLIYCCGLRLSECLSLTVHDIRGDENKLWVRGGKGHKDRMVPIAKEMVEDLRNYWKVHRNPKWIFPNVGRGQQHGEALAARMREAKATMPTSSLQRLLTLARKELDMPDATPHTLRHSFATHMLEAGASIQNIQKLLGHAHVNTTMVYLHLTHQAEENALELVEQLSRSFSRWWPPLWKRRWPRPNRWARRRAASR